MVNSLYWYLVFTLFIPDIISDFPLLLHSCTDLKLVFLYFLCRKELPFTKKKFSTISKLWWYFEMGGGSGILSVVFWYSGPLLIALICIMGICGLYMGSSLLIPSMVTRQFILWFFLTASFSNCVDGHPSSCWNILAASDPLISRLWKYYLLISTVFRKL